MVTLLVVPLGESVYLLRARGISGLGSARLKSRSSYLDCEPTEVR